MSPLHGVLQQSGGNQSGGVSHVNHQQGTHLVGNLAHALVVPLAAVGRAAADNQLRLVLHGQLLHLVVVHAARLLVQVVAYGLIEDATGVHQRAVREVTAVSQVQTHERVARLQHGQQHGGVGLSAGVGLHVGIFGIEELADALDGQLLNLVDHLAAAVVALAGIALGILVRQVRAHSLHHLVANEVLTGNQLNAFQLALMLFLNQLEDLVVSFHFRLLGF